MQGRTGFTGFLSKDVHSRLRGGRTVRNWRHFLKWDPLYRVVRSTQKNKAESLRSKASSCTCIYEQTRGLTCKGFEGAQEIFTKRYVRGPSTCTTQCFAPTHGALRAPAPGVTPRHRRQKHRNGFVADQFGRARTSKLPTHFWLRGQRSKGRIKRAFEPDPYDEGRKAVWYVS